MHAVEFDHVSKSYSIYDSPGARLRELVTFNGITCHRDFEALKDVSFSIRRGEVFCLVGANGAGKSTALQLMAGIMQPTAGNVRVQGRVAALLELGSGFNPQFSGRENVYLNASILGLTRRDIEALMEKIELFAEIGEFIDRPVRTYSSGMVMRLAFAVAIHVDPEVLIVDEALAVGDIYFRHRCMRRVNEMRERGVTIIFVSHSMADVRALGDRAAWLDRGRIAAIGDTESVVDQYLAAMKMSPASITTGASRHQTVDTIPNADHRHGNRIAELTGIAVLNEFGEPLHLVTPRSRCTVRLSVRANTYVEKPDIGVLLRNHLGLDFAEASATREGRRPGPLSAGERVTVEFHFDVPEIYPGSFSFSPWVVDNATGTVCDWIDNAITVQMARGESPVYGYVQIPCRVRSNAETTGETQLV